MSFASQLEMKSFNQIERPLLLEETRVPTPRRTSVLSRKKARTYTDLGSLLEIAVDLILAAIATIFVLFGVYLYWINGSQTDDSHHAKAILPLAKLASTPDLSYRSIECAKNV